MSLLTLFLSTFTFVNPEPEGMSLVPVTLRIEMDLAESVTEVMTDEVAAILAPVGVRLLPIPPSARTAATLVLRERPAVARIAGCRRDLHDHRLALTVLDRGLIVLWTEQIEKAARGDWDSDKTRPLEERELGRALGRVLAHELGHLLLGLRQHEPSGLMRGSFRHRELTGRRSQSMRLALPRPEVLEDYRARLLRYLEATGAN